VCFHLLPIMSSSSSTSSPSCRGPSFS
jgi:hypothetical protein